MDHNKLESSTQYAVPCINKKKTPKQVNRSFFQVAKRLYLKARLIAKPLIWKWLLIVMQIKLIFTRKVLHLMLFWKCQILELLKFEIEIFEMVHTCAVLGSTFSTPHKKVQSIFSFDLHGQLLRCIKSYLHISFMFWSLWNKYYLVLWFKLNLLGRILAWHYCFTTFQNKTLKSFDLGHS